MFFGLWWLLWVLEQHQFLAENLREEKSYGLRRPIPKHVLSNTVERYPSPSDQGEYYHFKIGIVLFLDSFTQDYVANSPSRILLIISQTHLIVGFHLIFALRCFCSFPLPPLLCIL